MILDSLYYLSIIFLSIIFMEIVAIFTHKYIMHGIGWVLHKSHHQKRKSLFELNDIYFIFFSLPSIFSIIWGLLYYNYLLLSIGIGIMLYGMIYMFLHDLVVHGRFGFNKKFKNSYFAKIKKAHMKHHKTKSKHGATNFGFISYR